MKKKTKKTKKSLWSSITCKFEEWKKIYNYEVMLKTQDY